MTAVADIRRIIGSKTKHFSSNVGLLRPIHWKNVPKMPCFDFFLLMQFYVKWPILRKTFVDVASSNLELIIKFDIKSAETFMKSASIE